MESMGIVIAAMIGVAAAVFIALFLARNRRQAWESVARAYGLAFRPGSLFGSDPAISGIFQGVPVYCTVIYRGSGKNRTAYTRATAQFAVDMPGGLHVGYEGLGATFAKFFGGQDIAIGDPDVDEALRIQAADESSVRALFSRPRAKRAIVRFVTGSGDTMITEAGAELEIRGHCSNASMLDSLLKTVADTVNGVEAGLRYHPPPQSELSPPPPDPLPPPDPPPPPAPSVSAAEGSALAGGAAGATALVDKLVAELEKEGTSVDDGVFTIDRGVAREKMREYMLRDPINYVLNLMQAALLKGASFIDVDVDSDDVRIQFDGRPFSIADFDGLYNSIFVSGGDSDLMARQRLALGLNAAMALDPKFARVISSDGAKGAELELKPGVDDRFGPTDDKEKTTRIHVRARLSQMFSGHKKKVVNLLGERLAYAPVKVVVSGSTVSGGLHVPSGWGVVNVEEDGLNGVCGFTDRCRRGARLHLVDHGVLIARTDLTEFPAGFLAVVDSNRFKQDLSQTGVVRDREFERAVWAAGKALSRAFDKLCDDLARHSRRAGFPRRLAEHVILERTLRYRSLEDFRPGGGAEALGIAPIWATIADTRVSLSQLVARMDQSGFVDYADISLRRWNLDAGSVRGSELVLQLNWRTDPVVGGFLRRIFGDHLRSVSDEIRARLKN